MRYIYTILFILSGFLPAFSYHITDTIRLDEIMVSAEKREISPIQLPVSVSVLTTEQIPAKGSIDIRSISGLIPNFYIQEYGLKLSTPVFIRGIGTPTANPTVGLYLDGVPVFDKNTYVFDLYDIRQIEVLRGPQGTLQGRNTLGGMINILSSSPSNKYHLSAKVGYSSYNTQNYNVLLNIPFASNFYNKFLFAYNSSDGFFKNKMTDKKVDNNRGYTLRYQGRWLPGNHWDIQFGVDYYNTRDGGYCYYNPDSLKKEHYEVSFNSPSLYSRDLVNSHLNIKRNFTNTTLNWITSYAYYDDFQKTDQDYSNLDIYYNEKPSHQHLVTQEINLQSEKENRKLEWIVGMFGFYKDLTNRVTTNYQTEKDTVKIEVVRPGMPFPVKIPILRNYLQDLYRNNTTTKGLAGFGQITVKNLLPGLFITAGLRYDTEYACANYSDELIRVNGNSDTSFRQSRTFQEWLPKLSIMQKWSERMTSYLTVSKGYRAGGYNIVLNYDRDNLKYNSDYTWNYELGHKYASRSGNFRLNAAIFYIDWIDQQIFQMEMNSAVIKNGGNAFSTGAEADLIWRFHPEFIYNLSVGYTHAEYSDYSGENMAGTFDYKKNCLPMVPEYTFNTGLSYHKTVNRLIDAVNVFTNVTGIGTQYFDESNDRKLRQKAYFIWNASCELIFNKRFTLEVWSKNLLNQHYFAYMLGSPLSMISGRDDLKYLGQSGSPATVGVSLSLSL